jgi:hypothetical protein
VKEESLLLRLLVLVLAAIAIISFDLGIDSKFSYGLIPICAMGSLWSYVCRHFIGKYFLIHFALLGCVIIGYLLGNLIAPVGQQGLGLHPSLFR